MGSETPGAGKETRVGRPCPRPGAAGILGVGSGVGEAAGARGLRLFPGELPGARRGAYARSRAAVPGVAPVALHGEPGRNLPLAAAGGASGQRGAWGEDSPPTSGGAPALSSGAGVAEASGRGTVSGCRLPPRGEQAQTREAALARVEGAAGGPRFWGCGGGEVGAGDPAAGRGVGGPRGAGVGEAELGRGGAGATRNSESALTPLGAAAAAK